MARSVNISRRLHSEKFDPIESFVEIGQCDDIRKYILEWFCEDCASTRGKKCDPSRAKLSLEISRTSVHGTGFDKGITGGPLSIMHFAREVMRTGMHVRWINIDGKGLHGEEMRSHAKKYDFLAQFARDVEFVFNAYNTTIRCHPDDMFMSTYYFTSQISHFTIQANPLLNQRNFLYFIQDAEHMFFPHDSNYIEALESYRLPHFAIYSTPFLQSWFKSSHTGQYEFIQGKSNSTTDIETFQFTTKPAIKKYPKLSAKLFSNP
eukprot:gene33038-42747_t